jgi:cell wall-associated NlpC family hydrolase
MTLQTRQIRKTTKTTNTPSPRQQRAPRFVVLGIIGVFSVLLLTLLAVPAMIGANMFFAATAGCSGQQTGTAGQPAASAQARSIPANYLNWYKKVGQQYGVPWPILAGIGTVESNNGQTTLPGVHSGQNGFGAAGPMQIGIEGASGNTWGGAPIHPASQATGGVATDEDGDGIANVYDPADAIAGSAKYLLQFQVQSNPAAAIFAYNHLQSYVQSVLYWAGVYAGGKYQVVSANMPSSSTAAGCALTGNVPAVTPPTQAVATAIAYAQAQIGKPYLWGGTGPDAFDCSGLVMMAYRTAGITIARTSEQQWVTEQRIPASQVEPGDLVFFAGADGTATSPGHVGLVIGHGQMIEAYATGFPVRIASYNNRGAIGFTRPWTQPGATGTPTTPSTTGTSGAPTTAPAPSSTALPTVSIAGTPPASPSP